MDDDLTPARPVRSQLDPSQSNFITILGRKGSGKSVLAERLWASYPYDRLVVDPTGDVDPGPDTRTLTAPLPSRFPVDAEGRRVSLRYVPDPGSPTNKDDLDRACGIVFRHRRTMFWIDEVAELTHRGMILPNFNRMLQQGRHRDLTLVCCGPRPLTIDPLVIAQADYLYLFHMPNPADRKRVAETIGMDPKDLEAAMTALARYEYLRWDAREQELVHFPPLPERPTLTPKQPGEGAGFTGSPA